MSTVPAPAGHAAARLPSTGFEAPPPRERPHHPPLRLGLRGPLLAGAATIILGLGGFMAFAATVPVAEAVVAPGVLTVETDRKKLQHLEGGIVREIHVREGERVQAGAVLFRLAPLKAQVDASVLANAIAANEALEARLLAERDGVDRMSAPPEAADPITARVWADQERQLGERLAALRGDLDILRADPAVGGWRRGPRAREAGRPFAA